MTHRIGTHRRYVAKYGAVNGCEYLGSFEDVESASEAYGLANAEFQQTSRALEATR